MRLEKHPADYPIDALFPDMKLFAGFEGGAVHGAEKDGLFYLIQNEGTMIDFLLPGEDDDLLNTLVKIYIFDSDEERKQYVEDRHWSLFDDERRL